jgi:hypothetical protein
MSPRESVILQPCIHLWGIGAGVSENNPQGRRQAGEGTGIGVAASMLGTKCKGTSETNQKHSLGHLHRYSWKASVGAHENT